MDIGRDLARALADGEALRTLSRNRATFHQVWEAAADAGIAPYLAWRVAQTESFGWATATIKRAHDTQAEATLLERARRDELERLARALADGRVPALLMDAAAVAYFHYPDPALRPRTTISLLVANPDRGEAERTLSAAGYEADLRGPRRGGAQCRYRRRDRASNDEIDLHWRIGDAPGLGEPMTFDEMWRRRVPLAQVPQAQTFVAPDRLLAACLTLRRSGGDGPPLLESLDTHLIAGSLTIAQWQDFLDRACALNLQAACARQLRHVVDLFATTVPADVAEWMEAPVPSGVAITRAQPRTEYRHRAAAGVWGWFARVGR